MSEEDIPYITDKWRCSACGTAIDVELIGHYDLIIERSGATPGTAHYPTSHWFEANFACPSCGVRLDYADSS